MNVLVFILCLCMVGVIGALIYVQEALVDIANIMRRRNYEQR